MSSQEERMLILRMIDEGRISVDEGARLLSAIQGSTAENSGEDSAPADGEAETRKSGETKADDEQPSRGNLNRQTDSNVRNMRIRVTDPATNKQKVNVNLPIGLVEFGLRFVPEKADPRVDNVRQAVQNGQPGRVIDIQEQYDGNRVEVILE